MKEIIKKINQQMGVPEKLLNGNIVACVMAPYHSIYKVEMPIWRIPVIRTTNVSFDRAYHEIMELRRDIPGRLMIHGYPANEEVFTVQKVDKNLTSYDVLIRMKSNGYLDLISKKLVICFSGDCDEIKEAIMCLDPLGELEKLKIKQQAIDELNKIKYEKDPLDKLLELLGE